MVVSEFGGIWLGLDTTPAWRSALPPGPEPQQNAAITIAFPVPSQIRGEAVDKGWADEVARIVALGGSVRDTHDDHTVMLDPEGTAFCVQDAEE
ncbi:MAG: VOC family protein [Phenylobacterium sp.]|uniref:VOC family protein n=1 Tax=Phenylobacterium sp. TaxID=1871053 RepID=UPI003BB74310